MQSLSVDRAFLDPPIKLMMDILTFILKLRQLNPYLYVDIKNTIYRTNPEFGTCGIYLGNKHREQLSYTDAEAENYEHIKKHNASDLEYLFYTNSKYVPEVNEYNEKGNIISPGLREILQRLVALKHISKAKVNKYFGKSYLTRSWWDALNDTQKKRIRLNEKE